MENSTVREKPSSGGVLPAAAAAVVGALVRPSHTLRMGYMIRWASAYLPPRCFHFDGGLRLLPFARILPRF